MIYYHLTRPSLLTFQMHMMYFFSKCSFLGVRGCLSSSYHCAICHGIKFTLCISSITNSYHISGRVLASAVVASALRECVWKVVGTDLSQNSPSACHSAEVRGPHVFMKQNVGLDNWSTSSTLWELVLPLLPTLLIWQDQLCLHLWEDI